MVINYDICRNEIVRVWVILKNVLKKVGQLYYYCYIFLKTFSPFFSFIKNLRLFFCLIYFIDFFDKCPNCQHVKEKHQNREV